jgi:hypothetical protein
LGLWVIESLKRLADEIELRFFSRQGTILKKGWLLTMVLRRCSNLRELFGKIGMAALAVLLPLNLLATFATRLQTNRRQTQRSTAWSG